MVYTVHLTNCVIFLISVVDDDISSLTGKRQQIDPKNLEREKEIN
jgi:hypothetical protein